MTGIMLMRVALAMLAPGLGSPAPAATAKLNVVATTADLGALAQAIGGSAVSVQVLAKPTEDAHFVDAKPSFIVTLNRADVLIDGGAELELGWLPPLLESARNRKIAVGAPGRIVGSEGIQLMDIPTSFDRAKGDIHALGNPHFMIDPVRAKTVAAHIAATFSELEPSSATTFQANLKKFNAAIDAKMVEWQKQLAPYKGAKIVTYHKDFPYFTQRFGLEIVEQLEPKPGIAPSPAHLAQVISTMRSTGAKVILLQPYQNRRTAQTVARQTGAVVLDMPQQPGAVKNVNGYIELIDYLVTTLANGLKGAR